MSFSQKITDLFTSNYLEVKNTIAFKIGDSQYDATATYDIYLKKEKNQNFDVSIDRQKFKVNDQEIEDKFASISNRYFNCLFPMCFNLEKDQLVATNFEATNKRIAKVDTDLKNNMDGEGLEYISDQFLSQTNSNEKIIALIDSLAIVKILNLALLRYEKKSNFNLTWTVPSVGKTFFKNILKKEIPSDGIEYESNELDTTKFLDFLNQYHQENKLNLILNSPENKIFGTFRQNFKYANQGLRVTMAETEIKISLNDYLKFEETIILQSMID